MLLKNLPASLLAASLLVLPAAAAPDPVPTPVVELLLQSGPKRVALLELYTSQGCSSCPPADRWLSRLEQQPGLWSQLVPVAFHVDYWDYIGWRDPFARPAYSERQRRYARQGGVGTVYTPGVLLNGKEWRSWRMTDRPRPPASRAGSLRLERRGDSYAVQFRPTVVSPEPLQATVALLGFDLLSEVTAGENLGRDLLNDFIVLDWRQSRLRRDAGIWTADLPAFEPGPEVPRLALAVWVSADGRQAPLQAAGGWLE